MLTGDSCGEAERRIKTCISDGRFEKSKHAANPIGEALCNLRGWGARGGALMRERLSLRMKNDLLEIERMTQEVSSWSHEQAFPEEVEYQIELVLDELVSNVMRHGLKDGKEHFIAVNLGRDGHDLTVEIEDDGVPFNPIDAPIPDITKPIEERRIGGLGIHLVRQIMDSLSYERRAGKNYLLMKKRLAEEP
jgi:serine/threonine-protein kinase RsbW